jgi:hypothetical protein
VICHAATPEERKQVVHTPFEAVYLDSVYLTVLVLDALELAAGRGNVTFRLHLDGPAIRGASGQELISDSRQLASRHKEDLTIAVRFFALYQGRPTIVDSSTGRAT